MFGNSGLSLADIAAVTGNRDGNNGDGFGGGNGWWVLIILFAIFGGWGNGGMGNNGNRNSGSDSCNTTTVIPVPMGGYGMGGYGYGSSFGFTDAAMQRGFDTQTIITKLDGLNSGLCGLGYDQLAQMNGINSNIMQTGFGITNAIQNASVNEMQNFNALSTQLGQCCCENRQGQAQIEFALSQLGCALQNTMNQNTQAIMQNDNANFRALHDEMIAMRMEDKNELIAQLRQQLNNCDRDGALAALEARLVDRISPCSRPSYLTCNPNTGLYFPYGFDLSQYMGAYQNGCGGCCGTRSGCCN